MDMKVLVPFLISVLIVASIGLYLQMLISELNSKISEMHHPG